MPSSDALHIFWKAALLVARSMTRQDILEHKIMMEKFNRLPNDLKKLFPTQKPSLAYVLMWVEPIYKK